MTAHTANGKATAPRKPAKPRAAKAAPDQPPKTPRPGRDAHGKFQPGNSGGVGNPYARQVAILRRELMQTTSPADIRNIGLKLKTLALEGNVQAAKLLFAYNLGLPSVPESPDRDNINELELFHEEANLAAVRNPHTPGCGGLGLQIGSMRFNRLGNAYNHARAVTGAMTATPAERKKHAKETAGLPQGKKTQAFDKYGAAKDWPPFVQSESCNLDWQPWPEPTSDTQPPSPGMTAANPPAAPSTNGSNGKHAAAAPTASVAAPTNPPRVTSPPRQQGPTKPAPSRNGTIGARSKYALLPKSMRPKGVIVPRF